MKLEGFCFNYPFVGEPYYRMFLYCLDFLNLIRKGHSRTWQGNQYRDCRNIYQGNSIDKNYFKEDFTRDLYQGVDILQIIM